MIPTLLSSCRRYLNPRPLRGYNFSTHPSSISTRNPGRDFDSFAGFQAKGFWCIKIVACRSCGCTFWQFDIFVNFLKFCFCSLRELSHPSFFKLFKTYFMKFCYSFHAFLRFLCHRTRLYRYPLLSQVLFLNMDTVHTIRSTDRLFLFPVILAHRLPADCCCLSSEAAHCVCLSHIRRLHRHPHTASLQNG